ncbi:Zinc finger protein [Melia azedarach]|uniref:Zinc finger protein n=1 Tax=Melia azedarach TaxID=155640 RepID=A0ACC1XR61_MELAZ|nr:Zinc finger protein [Melia azedarach]
MREGREGDWECNGCNNRNYAFRSFCNRCKQPRLLVDTKTPADSKWLPRIGDWICAGCTNNNYASREKCKKCGQPKEIAAMPTIAVPGASLPTYSHYFARAPGGAAQKINVGLAGNGAVQQFPLNSNWSLAGTEKYGVNSAASWPLAGNHSSGLSYNNLANQAASVMKEWRNGDWICNCGFHNYSSRAQCKKCNAPPPPGYTTLGTKRLASEEFVHECDNKRLNSGHTIGPQRPYPGFEQVVGSHVDLKTGVYAPYAAVSSVAGPNWQAPVPFPYQATVPALVGKGAKQWRDGDWMCTNCNNHNYASRSECNRCKTQRDTVPQPVSAT